MLRKRLLSTLLTLCAALVLLPGTARAAESGFCGNTLTWVLDDIGTLNISGKGMMVNYTTKNDPPWKKYHLNITRADIGAGAACIGDYAFAGCNNLASVSIPDSVVRIGEAAFYRCGITDVVIPDGVASIGRHAFALSKLTSVTIPDSVAAIGSGAFFGCGLTDVSIPDHVASIDKSAFSDCGDLTSVTISGNITVIREFMFRSCVSLTSVTIPDSVTRIERGVFLDCGSLADIYYPGTKSQWKRIKIDTDGNDVLEKAVIHCSNGVIVPPSSPSIFVFLADLSGGRATVAADPAALAALPKAPAVLTAVLDGDRVTSSARGELAAATGEITFQASLKSGDKLFFLDPDTFIPLARPAVLE